MSATSCSMTSATVSAPPARSALARRARRARRFRLDWRDDGTRTSRDAVGHGSGGPGNRQRQVRRVVRVRRWNRRQRRVGNGDVHGRLRCGVVPGRVGAAVVEWQRHRAIRHAPASPRDRDAAGAREHGPQDVHEVRRRREASRRIHGKRTGEDLAERDMVEPCHPFHRQARHARPRNAPSGDQFVRNRTEREDAGRPAPGTLRPPAQARIRPAHRHADPHAAGPATRVDDPGLPGPVRRSRRGVEGADDASPAARSSPSASQPSVRSAESRGGGPYWRSEASRASPATYSCARYGTRPSAPDATAAAMAGWRG